MNGLWMEKIHAPLVLSKKDPLSLFPLTLAKKSPLFLSLLTQAKKAPLHVKNKDPLTLALYQNQGPNLPLCVREPWAMAFRLSSLVWRESLQCQLKETWRRNRGRGGQKGEGQVDCRAPGCLGQKMVTIMSCQSKLVKAVVMDSQTAMTTACQPSAARSRRTWSVSLK